MSKTGANSAIYARHKDVLRESRLSIPYIKQCIRTAVRSEGVDVPFEVSVLITNDEEIRGINSRFRGVDAPTDVLSFPMNSFTPPERGDAAPEYDRDQYSEALDEKTGILMLGDIVMSAERVIYQADLYGHSKERETAYLAVHSVLHLLGYDHTDDADGKKKMRAREKEIMRYLER